MRLLAGAVVRVAASAAPDAPAVSLGPRTLTFGALDAAANHTATALRSAGIARGSRVAWTGATDVDAAVLFVALARLGAAFVPLNPRFTDAERNAVLAVARPALVIGRDAPLATFLGGLTGDVGAPAADATDPELAEHDDHVVFFTSGSTGAPKGVVISHRASWLRAQAGSTGAVPGATVCMFPLFHMAAWSMALGCWQARQQCVFVDAPTPDALLGAVARHDATRLYAIPAVWARLLDAGFRADLVASLREADTGTSATPPELIAAIKDALPHTVTRVFYGSTEAGPGTVLHDHDLRAHPGSAGLPAPGVEVAIGAGGEVLLRSPFLMTGYLGDPDGTAATLRDGWYHSGDAGVVDGGGYLTITGRLRDVIRTGGETVAPAEVEAVLAGHPAVADVAVVGVPDAEWGEVVCAVVVPVAGTVLDLAALRGHCAAALAPPKQPRRMATVDVIPRTPATGQVQRALLVERIVSGGLVAGA